MTAPRCLDGGFLVGTQYPLPDDTRRYYVRREEIVGCNRMFCADCGTFVRHYDGVRLVRDLLSRRELEDLAASRNAAEFPLLARALVANDRFYFCRCMYDETAGASPASWVDDANWSCAGHPQDI